MEVAVEEINAKGGLQIEFNAQDDEADGEKSVNAYNTLMDWGMQVLVGPTTTGASMSVADACYNDRTFMITPSASAVALALASGLTLKPMMIALLARASMTSFSLIAPTPP